MGVKETKVMEPFEHFIIENSTKKMHGWTQAYEPNHARECTAERLLINPYNGCTFDCSFCYAHDMTFNRYMARFKDEKKVTVFKDYDKAVADQLSKMPVASCGYISAVTDPFQPINKHYQLTEKIIEVFADYGLPVDIITKGVISERAIYGLKRNPYSFAQVTILTADESLRQKVAGGATTDQLFDNIKRLKDNGIYAVARIDPIMPRFNDSGLDVLIKTLADIGVDHIISSVMDISSTAKNSLMGCLEKIRPGITSMYFPENSQSGYSVKIGSKFHANDDYRRGIFGKLRESCDKAGITFAVCMEFVKDGDKLSGLNKEFMSSKNCEGMNTPIFIKGSDGKFESLDDCVGNCIACHNGEDIAVCKIPKLKEASNLKLADYKQMIQREFDFS